METTNILLTEWCFHMQVKNPCHYFFHFCNTMLLQMWKLTSQTSQTSLEYQTPHCQSLLAFFTDNK